jgi:hypothetical protein
MAKSGKSKIGDGASVESGGGARASYDYSGLNRFRMKVRPKSGEGEGATFVFDRRGVFSWKMTRIELPASLMNDQP